MFNKERTNRDEELKINQTNTMSEELTEEQLENVNGGSIGFAVVTVTALAMIGVYQYCKHKRRR